MSSWANLSAVGILAIVAMMIFTGMLVPWRNHNETKKERDEWKEAYNKLREKYDERFDSRMAANTEALALVQKSFEAITDGKTKAD